MSYRFAGYNSNTGALYVASTENVVPATQDYFAIMEAATGKFVDLTNLGGSYTSNYLTAITAATWTADYVKQLVRLQTSDASDSFLHSTGAQSFTELPAGEYEVFFFDGNTVGDQATYEIDLYYISETWQRTDLRRTAQNSQIDTVVDALTVSLAALSATVGANGAGLTEVTLADETITADKFATDAITAGALSAAAANEIAAAVAANVPGTAYITSALETATSFGPVSQQEVEDNLTITLVPESGEALSSGTSYIELLLGTSYGTAVGDDSVLCAVDFVRDLGAGNRLSSISSITLISGTEGGVTVSTVGIDHTLAKFTLTPVTAGTYVFLIRVKYVGSNAYRSGYFTVKVIDPADTYGT